MMLLPTTPSRAITAQFEEIIRRGYKYLQSGSRNLGIAVLAGRMLLFLAIAFGVSALVH